MATSRYAICSLPDVYRRSYVVVLCLIGSTIPVNHTCNRIFSHPQSGKTYCVLGDKPGMNIQDASRACLDQGYYLLSLDDQEESDFITGQNWWSEYSSGSKYWLRLIYDDGWRRWLDCRAPTWTYWESIYSGSDMMCSYASPESSHLWRYLDCDDTSPDLVLCEKEDDNCLVHMDVRQEEREYCLITQPTNFTHAENVCQKMEYNKIAQFETLSEMMDVFDLFVIKGLSCQIHSHYWLGLTSENSGSWRWRDGSAIEWSNWQAPPVETDAADKSCGAALFINDKWEVRDCSENHVFLCEKGPANFEDTTTLSTANTAVSTSILPTVETPTQSTLVSSTTLAELSTLLESTSKSFTSFKPDDVTSGLSIQMNQTTAITSTVIGQGTHPTTITSSTPTTDIFCPSFINLDRIVVNITSTSVGSRAAISCFSGTAFRGGFLHVQSVCQLNGRWNLSGLEAGCQDVTCAMLDESSHRMVSSQVRTLGHSVNLVCSHGYMFGDGSRLKTITCDVNGRWEPEPENCQAVTCPPIPVWYGFVTNTTERRYLTVVNATCGNQQTLTSGAASMVSVCRVVGGWTPPFTLCHDSTTKYTGVKEADKAFLFGILSFLPLVTILTIIVAIDIKFFKFPKEPRPKPKHRSKIRKKRNRVFPLETSMQNHTNHSEDQNKGAPEIDEQPVVPQTQYEIIDETERGKLPNVPTTGLSIDSSLAALL